MSVTDQGGRGQARPGRARPGRQGGRPGAARRRHGGHLHRPAPDPGADRGDRDPGGRRRGRAVRAVRRAHDAVPAGASSCSPSAARPTSWCSAAASSRTADIPELERLGVAKIFTPGRDHAVDRRVGPGATSATHRSADVRSTAEQDKREGPDAPLTRPAPLCTMPRRHPSTDRASAVFCCRPRPCLRAPTSHSTTPVQGGYAGVPAICGLDHRPSAGAGCRSGTCAHGRAPAANVAGCVRPG